ncbi:phage tail protein [Campylobacter concisus]|uniref:phage tail protein n=1 Tax=Campylobacter concisus TaxID=199 RepID=UPI000D347A1F|nr:phage tail protein [Campylobacter concisus]
MVTIEELKLGNRTLEALKFLLSQITELETAISQINISEIKDANTLTKQQLVTLQDVKVAVESINTELSSKKSDFDEKKQNFDTNMNAFRNDKADFDEKKADFDSKNNTALSNFTFIASNIEKINKTSDLLAEAKAILEQIKPIEQRAQSALETLANSQSKFAELDALKATLLELKRSLENISTTGLINDTSTSTTTTYSSVKINTLTQGLLRETDASENNTGGKIVRRNAAGNIYATNIYINEPTKAEVTTIKNSLAADKWRFLVRNSDEGILKTMSIKDFMAGQEVDAYTRSQSDAKYELRSTAYTKTESDAKYLRKADKIDAYSKIECDATFLKKTDKIDAYTKRESDDKFALKTELTDGLPIGAYLSYPSQKTIPAGFLLADGRSLKKSEYAELFTVIGYTYGGSTDNFNLPNFADGKFMRGIGGNAAALGTAQQDAIRNITGSLPPYDAGTLPANIERGAFKTVAGGGAIPTGTQGVRAYQIFDASLVVPTANENRPLNMAVVVIIKVKNVNTPTAGQIDKTILATETKAGIAKLKNAITAKQEDAAVTEKAVAEAIEANKGIGAGQTWQDVKKDRKQGVIYTNATGRAIMINVAGAITTNPSEDVQLFINDVLTQKINIGNRSGYVCAVVPAGATYKVTTSASSQINPSSFVWMELR